MKRDGWYASRSYAHFDLPLPFDRAKEYVSDPNRVKSHSFHPFLSFDIVHRRYRAGPPGKRVSAKQRPISVAAHIDGHIFSYYAKILAERYEIRLAADGLGHCVLAYRSGLGSNIEFAKSTFGEIARRGQSIAIALDLEDFFGSIDHATLKRNWAQLLGAHQLPPDHYSVFRAITKYAEVSLNACRERLGIKGTKGTPRPICSPPVFRTVIRKNHLGLSNLVVTNGKTHGIPQGSQISALLSNLYMLDFDRDMSDLAETIGGSYRRYSDDILWICRAEDISRVEEGIRNGLAKLGGATRVNDTKTERSVFFENASGVLECDRPIQYLGFIFDGRKIRIRSQTLSKYSRRMVYAVRTTKRAASQSVVAHGIVYKRALYRQLSHLGRRNLISYAKRSESVMGTGAIRAQIRRHIPRIARELGRP